MKPDLENKLIAVVRVRGTLGVRRTIKETLMRMNVNRVNSLALIYGTKPNLGMIKKCNDFVTYGAITLEMLEKVLARKEIKASKEDMDAVMTGKKRAQEIVKLPIGLKPPRHGYEGIKRGFSNGGALGYRGEEINKLISKMV